MKNSQRQSIERVAQRTGRALFGNGLSGFTDDLKASWQAAITDFQQKRADLDAAESALYQVYPSISEQDDLDEWQRVFNKVNASMSGMDAVASLVQGAADIWNSFTGAIGMSGIRRRGITSALGSLGFALPLLPISLGTLAGLVATAAAAIALAYGFVAYINNKYSMRQQLIDAGVDPLTASKQASEEAQQASGYSFGGRLEKIAIYVGIAAVLVAFSPAFKKK